VTDRGVLDTSVFIASESGRPLDAVHLPEQGLVSVITLAELHVGVLAAPDTDTTARRLQTLRALGELEALPITESAAVEWARLRYRLTETGQRLNVNDLWIAATALSLGLPVVTQDRDFDALEGIGGPAVIQV
jgi:predicted nucleic acid-binding protein